MLPNVLCTVVVGGCHREAFRRAHSRTESAEAALAHVDVELGSVDSFRCSIGCLAEFGGRFDGLDGNTIHRAYLGTLVANDAVIYFIVQLVPAVVGYWNGFVRILNGGDAGLIVKIVGLCYIVHRYRFPCRPNMAPRETETGRDGAYGFKKTLPITLCLHG